MRIVCSSCNKVYNIPDERLPIGKEVSFACKACKGVIKIDLRSKSEQDITPSTQASQEEKREASGHLSPFAKSQESKSGEALKKRILRAVGDLPPMPQTVQKARKIMRDPKSNFRELAKVLETDPAMATRVLKMSNSSYYGLSGEVTSLQHASVVLGYKTIGDLMTIAGTSDLLSNTLKGYGMEAGDLWQHSMGVAFGSRIIAAKKRPGLADDAFAAGIIHDSGKLILDRYIEEQQKAFQEFMADGQQMFLSAEKQILGFDHAEIAYEVCKSWNIPEALTVAIRYHHYPSHSDGSELAYIVHVADSMAMMTGMGIGIDGMLYKMEDKAMEFLGLQEEEMPDIMAELAESVGKIADEALSA